MAQSLDGQITGIAMWELIGRRKAVLLCGICSHCLPMICKRCRRGRRDARSLWYAAGGAGQPAPLEQALNLGYRWPTRADAFEFKCCDFIQVKCVDHQMMFNQALANVLDIQPVERVLDLFCGVGKFCSGPGPRGRSGSQVEGIADMVERAQRMHGLNQLESLHFLQATCPKP